MHLLDPVAQYLLGDRVTLFNAELPGFFEYRVLISFSLQTDDKFALLGLAVHAQAALTFLHLLHALQALLRLVQASHARPRLAVTLAAILTTGQRLLLSRHIAIRLIGRIKLRLSLLSLGLALLVLEVVALVGGAGRRCTRVSLVSDEREVLLNRPRVLARAGNFAETAPLQVIHARPTHEFIVLSLPRLLRDGAQFGASAVPGMLRHFRHVITTSVFLGSLDAVLGHRSGAGHM